jgi:alginate O-acetyltransferase complex protein AlgI
VSFTSPLFYLALVPAVAAFYLLPGRWRAIYLLTLSYAFYALSSRIYLVLLIVASAAVYALGLAIAKSDSERAKQAFMAAGVAAVVALIVAFKAAGAWRGWLLPLGVSYYSFKLISYLIEVYWDDEAVERDPITFFLLPAFFPQIVSGPIQRPGPFFAQMREVAGRTLNVDQIETGFRFILGGLMMKLLIGDRLFAFIGAIGQSYPDYRYSVVVTTVACYLLQLYADFSGYTNIALGIGKLFGVEGPPNFNAPFAAVNIQDFWRRWHMSLTLWLTDYLFTPLSMSLRDYGEAGLIGAICLNMVIIGLWHGFTVNFLAFGTLHAVFLSATVLILARRKRAAAKTKTSAPPDQLASRVGRFLGAILTFTLVSLSMIFVYSPTWDKGVAILKQVVGATPSGSIGWSDMPANLTVPAWICMGIALFVGLGAPGARGLAQSASKLTPQWLQYGFCLFLLSVLSTAGSGQFIYGQF